MMVGLDSQNMLYCITTDCCPRSICCVWSDNSTLHFTEPHSIKFNDSVQYQ